MFFDRLGLKFGTRQRKVLDTQKVICYNNDIVFPGNRVCLGFLNKLDKTFQYFLIK